MSLLRSEACPASKLASMLPEKSPCYAFYSYPTPPPPPPAAVSAPAQKPAESPAKPRDMFQGTAGGARPVQASWVPKNNQSAKEESTPDVSEITDEPNMDTEPEVKADAEPETKNEEPMDESAKDPSEEKIEEDEKPSSLQSLSLSSPAKPTPGPELKVKGRVLFLYTCPSSSPIRFRMVYSSGVRGIQQDAADKAGIEITGKVGGQHFIPKRTQS